MLEKVRVAEADPETEGLKLTVKEALWPAGMVRGRERPLRAKTDSSLVEAADTVTLAPEAVRVPEADVLVPTTALPRGRVEGVTVSWPVAAMPEPDSGMLSEESEALEEMVREPEAEPAAEGAKATLKAALWPGLRVRGVEMPLRVKAEPERAIWEMVRAEPPELVRVSDKD